MQVECVFDSETCSIEWIVEEDVVDLDDPRYIINEEILPINIELNQFENVKSTFAWNFEELDNKRLATNNQNSTIKCIVNDFILEEGFWNIESSTNIVVECK